MDLTWSTKHSQAKVTHLIEALRIYYTQAEAIYIWITWSTHICTHETLSLQHDVLGNTVPHELTPAWLAMNVYNNMLAGIDMRCS